MLGLPEAWMVALELGELGNLELQGVITEALETCPGYPGQNYPCLTPLALEITTLLVTLAGSFCGGTAWVGE